MCSIAGLFHLDHGQIDNMKKSLEVMNLLQEHRGPDESGIWFDEKRTVGLAHNRLSIIGLANGKQPMTDGKGNWLCFNGEIYNYLELEEQLGCKSETGSDTEVILHAYRKWGEKCVDHLEGMFAFALWDEENKKLFCARDRFGIKPFYYTVVDGVFFFASEIKALLPFINEIETDRDSFKEYLTFQFCLEGKTLFKNIYAMKPAHYISLKDKKFKEQRYWQVYYNLDFNHTEKYFREELEERMLESMKYHVRSDVPVGGYVSGGVDSSIVSAIATKLLGGEYLGFTGKYSNGDDFDESRYAAKVSEMSQFPLHTLDIKPQDFIDNIEKVLYYLDEPVAGPGAFSQYMVSQLAGKYRKVVLGGQGGDEVFGGYTRYLVAYFEQCIKGAIEGTMNSGEFIVTYQSIIPNLTSLQRYKPMLRSFWRDGLFEAPEKRYFSLINRAPEVGDCVRWESLTDYDPYHTYEKLFTADNVNEKSYFDRMTHFDFKTLLPALLQVEDRMSMAHGLESRVPFLDRKLVEFAATIPANIKFKNGTMKYMLRESLRKYVPESVMNRTDKMGFPTPFNLYVKNEAHDFVMDIFTSEKAKNRELVNNHLVIDKIVNEGQFGRNIWGMFCLELWQRNFHDKHTKYKELLNS
ncbi:asparagine synthase (glutamine-hydrolyzing) [Anaerovorax sp. IOR16]|uniref:asparagine synthase (glutamine-hydrolyzing) n=1 Tax=Anaerovorax sp. IOR16 TaxID=2773458 RepID=UPI0019D246ED|nr:asparagine synthase (glutamine-hydrolyzing) [Anaerovorax sp. IOR16]